MIRRERLLRGLGVTGVVLLAVEFAYASINSVAFAFFFQTAGTPPVVRSFSLFFLLRFLFGPILFGLLTVCGVVALRWTAKRRAGRAWFATVLLLLVVLLLLKRPSWLGMALSGGLTVCGFFALRGADERRSGRAWFAIVFLALGVLLLLKGPPWIGVPHGAHFVWGNATLHILDNVTLLLATAVYLGAAVLAQPQAGQLRYSTADDPPEDRVARLG